MKKYDTAVEYESGLTKGLEKIYNQEDEATRSRWEARWVQLLDEYKGLIDANQRRGSAARGGNP